MLRNSISPLKTSVIMQIAKKNCVRNEENEETFYCTFVCSVVFLLLLNILVWTKIMLQIATEWNFTCEGCEWKVSVWFWIFQNFRRQIENSAQFVKFCEIPWNSWYFLCSPISFIIPKSQQRSLSTLRFGNEYSSKDRSK